MMRELITQFRTTLGKHQNVARQADEAWLDNVKRKFFEDFVAPTDITYIRYSEEMQELEREIAKSAEEIQSLIRDAE